MVACTLAFNDFSFRFQTCLMIFEDDRYLEAVAGVSKEATIEKEAALALSGT